MIWTHFVNNIAIGPRKRVIATALVYGLSLAVRFTSAAGEEVEVAPHFMQTPHPLVSMMTGSGSGLPYQDWGPKIARPVVFRDGWPPSSPPPRCIAP